eukprot:TRINITY_DN642_c0_g1_i1.p2 TRINITY_DN642_c0_g1~~TRINITY_DN642_c0_g1_i1.p2  ORF type:complete len:198 (-),score=18.95 TRINITY_DN642_c0_g1_i1:63-656(-)
MWVIDSFGKFRFSELSYIEDDHYNNMRRLSFNIEIKANDVIVMSNYPPPVTENENILLGIDSEEENHSFIDSYFPKRYLFLIDSINKIKLSKISYSSYMYQIIKFRTVIILWEIVNKLTTGTYRAPFSEYTYIKHDFQIIHQSAVNNLRPTIQDTFPDNVAELIVSCWDPNPHDRPSCNQLISSINSIRNLYRKKKY